MTEQYSQSEVQAKLARFMAERQWEQFHTPANLAKSIAIEAAELLECFQWNEDMVYSHVAEELADVLTYCYLLASKLSTDPSELILRKLALTEQKYPVAKAKGRSVKYDEL